ncbi:hypothetical protein O0I10_009010 [Lichtheimia ornata]|uniref:Uncharacterized protein n=1 Tax=Lichtheimia ornata TaxID=688661 RepID=A0AAD7UYL1_9FUNG|nr:uncharacterized protein O0I10_009010 [Lichtheimia ornata]KAJ8655321.1 hypothetical protein O0I10_009010 [Lichtheimia ornata]
MSLSTSSSDEFYGDHVHKWEEIHHLVSTNQVKLIRRNREGQRRYRAWIEDTLSKYKDIEDYLLTEKLHFPLNDDDEERPHVIVLPNDFPYSMEPGIQHILIWSQRSLKETYVLEILEERYGSSKWEWVYFVNPPETQSVRRLPHVHVFMRPIQLQQVNGSNSD